MMEPLDQAAIAMNQKVPRGQTMRFADRSIEITGTLMRTSVGLLLGLALPAVAELVVGIMRRDQECDRPLAWWLCVDGGVCLSTSVVTVLYTYCSYLRQYGDVDLHAYAIHKLRDGAFDEGYERRLEKIERTQRRLSCCQSCSFMLPLLLFFIGAVWRYQVESCDKAVKDWTLAVLIFRMFAPILSLCCALPLVFLCGGHVSRHMQHNSFEDSASSYSGSASDSEPSRTGNMRSAIFC